MLDYDAETKKIVDFDNHAKSELEHGILNSIWELRVLKYSHFRFSNILSSSIPRGLGGGIQPSTLMV